MESVLLNQLDQEFLRLGRRNHPTIDGSVLHSGLPQRIIGVVELRSILLHPSTCYDARDAALGEVIRRSQESGREWTTAVIGLLIHGLRRTAGRLTRGYEGDRDDLEAEMIAGLLEAIAVCDTTVDGVAARLLWSAHRRGLRFRFQETELPMPSDYVWPDFPAEGHPDFILEQAVAEGVLSEADADLIATTRYHEERLPEYAERIGISADTARRRRHRAEARLVAWVMA